MEPRSDIFAVQNNWQLWGNNFVVAIITLLILISNSLGRKRKNLKIESEIYFKSLFNEFPEGILIYNQENEVIFLNNEIRNLFNLHQLDLNIFHKTSILDVLPSGWIEQIEILKNSKLHKVQNKLLNNFRLRVPHRKNTYIELHQSNVFFDGKPANLLTLHDVSQKEELEQHFQYSALHDSLTNLPNRQLLNDRLVQSQAENFRNKTYGALLFIDIDNFKSVNDTYGHNQGDLVIQNIAKRLSDGVREVDTVARFSGDEFIVILHELGSDEKECAEKALKISNKLLTIVSKEMFINERRHIINVSIGISIYSNSTKTSETIMLDYVD